MKAILACLAAVVLSMATAAAHVRITTKVSWTRDIAPLVNARCVSCHRPGGRAPMPLVTYEDARPWARAIREEVLTRRMPKWHAARGYGDLLNDPSLSSFEIAMIVAWVDGGAPKNLPTALTPQLTGISSSVVPQPVVPAGAREVSLPCGNARLPTGRLLAVRPRLDDGASAGIVVKQPGGRQEIIAWIRDFDPKFEETYWLRRPLQLAAGSRLIVDASGTCRITVLLGRN